MYILNISHTNIFLKKPTKELAFGRNIFQQISTFNMLILYYFILKWPPLYYKMGIIHKNMFNVFNQKK